MSKPKTFKINAARPSERYAEMTAAEYRVAIASLQPPNEVVGKPLSDGTWRAMKDAALTERRLRGRPAKPDSEKVARVLVSMPREMLASLDAAVASKGTTRAGFIADLLRRKLKLNG